MTSNKKSCLVIILILGKYRSSSNIIVMFSKTLQKAAGIEKLNLKQTTLVHTVTGSGSPYCMYVCTFCIHGSFWQPLFPSKLVGIG